MEIIYYDKATNRALRKISSKTERKAKDVLDSGVYSNYAYSEYLRVHNIIARVSREHNRLANVVQFALAERCGDENRL